MFFSTYVLTQKGPLAKVWLAAHWDRRLTAKDVRLIDLNESVLQVVKPEVPIALRTSGELMLGIVRIYALKVAALLKDATDASAVLLRPRAVQLVKTSAGGKGADTTAIAITADVIMGHVGTAQMLEADFADVADILGPAGAGLGLGGLGGLGLDGGAKAGAKGGDQGAGDDAWYFATMPSQPALGAEEVADLHRMDAAMSEFRAQLHAASSKKGSGSTSTGAGSSVEGPRDAGAAAAAGATAAIDELAGVAGDADLLLQGMDAAPLGLDEVLQAAAADPLAGDLLATPARELGAAGDEAGATGAKTAARKTTKMVIVVDTHTQLTREELEHMRAHIDDIMQSASRHGPLDESEARDRTVLRQENLVADCAPLAGFVQATALRAAFQAALRAAASEQIAEIERLRGGAAARASMAARDSVAPAGGLADQLAEELMGPGAPDMAAFDMHGGLPPLPEEEVPAVDAAGRPSAATRRRARDDDEEAAEAAAARAAAKRVGIAPSALATLKRLRESLLAAGASTTTTLRQMSRGVKSREAVARGFVDVLVLASHQILSVHQAAPFGQITVSRGPKFGVDVSSLPAAAKA
jgi:cohesin complex subunit SCC1